MKKNLLTIFAAVLTVSSFVPQGSCQTVPMPEPGTQPVVVEDPIVSVQQIQQNLEEGGASSLTESIMESVEERLRARTQTTVVTEETVQSAIDAEMITEDPAAAVAPVDNAAVDAADTRTRRYQPRIALDFGTFPLRPLSGKIGLTEQDDDEVVVLEQTNRSLTEDIARRIQNRLSSPDIRFEFKNRTVILTGSVSAVRQRELAEAMLTFEPGIDRVENRITVK